jgi:hypothetical protein
MTDSTKNYFFGDVNRWTKCRLLRGRESLYKVIKLETFRKKIMWDPFEYFSSPWHYGPLNDIFPFILSTLQPRALVWQ